MMRTIRRFGSEVGDIPSRKFPEGKWQFRIKSAEPSASFGHNSSVVCSQDSKENALAA